MSQIFHQQLTFNTAFLDYPRSSIVVGGGLVNLANNSI